MVDAPADDVIPGLHLAGHALSCQGGGVHHGLALQHHAIQGDTLPGFHGDGIPHRHFLRVHLGQLAVPLHVGVVRANVHEAGDGFPGFAHGVALEQLPHLVEQHDEHGLGVLALAEKSGAEGPHRGQGHEEVLVEHLAMGDVPGGLPQHIPADDKIGRQEQHKPPRAFIGDEHRRHQKHPAGGNAGHHFLLFPCHKSQSLLEVFTAGRHPPLGTLSPVGQWACPLFQAANRPSVTSG